METSNTALEISDVSDPVSQPSKRSLYRYLKNHIWLIAVGLLVVIAAIPRLYRLNAVGLWLDECYQYYNATLDWDKIQERLAISQAPLSYYLSKLQITLFPWSGETFLRLPSVMLGLALIPVCYFLGKELFRKKEVGFLTALLATFWPILVNYSQEFRMYALFVFLAAASATLLLIGLRTRNVAPWFGLTLVNMLLLFTHYNTIFVQGAEGVFIGLYLLVELIISITKTKSIREGWKQQEKIIGYAVGSLALIGTAYLLYSPILLKFFGSGSEGLGSADKPLPFDLEIYKSIFSDLGLGKDFALLVVVVLAVMGVVSLLIRLPWSAVFTLSWFVVPFLVLSISKGGSGILVSPRYFIFFVPIYLAMVAGGLLFLVNGVVGLLLRLRPAFSNHLQKLRWGLMLIPLAVLAAFMVVSLGDYYAAPKQINTDARSAFEVIKNGTQSGDIVITFNGPDWDSGAPWFNFLYTSYYMRKPPEGLTVLKVEDWSNPKTFSKALKSNGRLWTMVTYSGDPQNLATLAGPEAQTTCFYRACAILQPNPPNTTMVQKFEKFLQSFNSLNPDLTKSIRDSLNQAKPLIANR